MYGDLARDGSATLQPAVRVHRLAAAASDDDAAEILRGAGLYAATDDGLVPWRDRPVIFRKQSLARIPPIFPAMEI